MKKWQKVKKYIANWKDVKKNMTKTDSIKKWLILLARPADIPYHGIFMLSCNCKCLPEL